MWTVSNSVSSILKSKVKALEQGYCIRVNGKLYKFRKQLNFIEIKSDWLYLISKFVNDATPLPLCLSLSVRVCILHIQY